MRMWAVREVGFLREWHHHHHEATCIIIVIIISWIIPVLLMIPACIILSERAYTPIFCEGSRFFSGNDITITISEATYIIVVIIISWIIPVLLKSIPACVLLSELTRLQLHPLWYKSKYTHSPLRRRKRVHYWPRLGWTSPKAGLIKHFNPNVCCVTVIKRMHYPYLQKLRFTLRGLFITVDEQNRLSESATQTGYVRRMQKTSWRFSCKRCGGIYL